MTPCSIRDIGGGAGNSWSGCGRVQPTLYSVTDLTFSEDDRPVSMNDIVISGGVLRDELPV